MYRGRQTQAQAQPAQGQHQDKSIKKQERAKVQPQPQATAVTNKCQPQPLTSCLHRGAVKRTVANLSLTSPSTTTVASLWSSPFFTVISIVSSVTPCSSLAACTSTWCRYPPCSESTAHTTCEQVVRGGGRGRERSREVERGRERSREVEREVERERERQSHTQHTQTHTQTQKTNRAAANMSKAFLVLTNTNNTAQADNHTDTQTHRHTRERHGESPHTPVKYTPQTTNTPHSAQPHSSSAVTPVQLGWFKVRERFPPLLQHRLHLICRQHPGGKRPGTPSGWCKQSWWLV